MKKLSSMFILSLVSAIVQTLVACAPAPKTGQAETVTRVEAKTAKNSNAKTTELKKIELYDIELKQQQEEFSFKSRLTLKGKDYGVVELKGRKAKGQSVVVVAPNEKLDKLDIRAKVVCLQEDEEGLCLDYYVNYYVKDESTGQQFADQYKTGYSDSQDKLETVPDQAVIEEVLEEEYDIEGGYETDRNQNATVTDRGFSVNFDKEAEALFKQSQEEINQKLAENSDFLTLPDINIAEEIVPVIIPKSPAEKPKSSSTSTSTSTSTTSTSTTSTSTTSTSTTSTSTTSTIPKKPEPPKEGVRPEPPKPRQNPEPSRPVNQAIGAPNKGSLRNATDFYEMTFHGFDTFKILSPKSNRHFGTYDLAELIYEIGKIARTLIPDWTIGVGAISAKNGGQLGTHKSHQIGVDADLAYLTTSASKYDFKTVIDLKNRKIEDYFLVEKQWELLKKTFATNKVNVIFVEDSVKKALCQQALKSGDLKNSEDRGIAYQILRRLNPEKNHNHHWHLRMRCGTNQTKCNQSDVALSDSGCF